MNAIEAAKNALTVTDNSTLGENLIIFCDQEKSEIGKMFAYAAISLGLWTRLVILEETSETRRNLNDHTKEIITSNNPDIMVNVFRKRDEETTYRIQFMRIERKKTDRILHCPGITMDMFTEGAAALTIEEYEDMLAIGDKIKDSLKNIHKVHVTCPNGSDFSLDLGGKEFKVEKGANIPTGEINVMPPIGDSFDGKLVAISGGAGRLYRETPVEIYSSNGLAGEVKCKDPEIRRRILVELDRDQGARYLGEFAIGINPKARLVDEFVEAEKVVGTIHVAFGGSYKPSRTHLDLLIENPTIIATLSDESQKSIMVNGEIKY